MCGLCIEAERWWERDECTAINKASQARHFGCVFGGMYLYAVVMET